MSLPESVIYRIGEGDYFAFNALVFRRTWVRSVLLGLPGAALIAVPVAWIERSFALGIGLVLVGLVVGSIYVFVLRMFQKPRARKIYRETTSLQEETTLIFEDEGFRTEQPSGLWRLEWRNLVRWDEDREIFAVFPNRAMAIIVPKQQVGEDVVNFMRKQMMQSGLERPWRLRK